MPITLRSIAFSGAALKHGAFFAALCFATGRQAYAVQGRCIQECAFVNGREVCRPCGSDWSDIKGGREQRPAPRAGDRMQLMAADILATAMSQMIGNAFGGPQQTAAERAQAEYQQAMETQKRKVAICQKAIADKRKFDQDRSELLAGIKEEGGTDELGLKETGPEADELGFKTLADDNSQNRQALAALQGDPARRGWCMLNLPLRPVRAIQEGYDCQYETAMENFLARRQAWQERCVRWAGGTRPAESGVVQVIDKGETLELKPLDAEPRAQLPPPEPRAAPLLRQAQGPSPAEWKEALAAQARLDELYAKIPHLSAAETEEARRLEEIRDAAWRKVARTPGLSTEEMERLKVRLLTRASPTAEVGPARFQDLSAEAEEGATAEERAAQLQRYAQGSARGAISVAAVKGAVPGAAWWLQKTEDIWREKSGLYRTPGEAVKNIHAEALDFTVKRLNSGTEEAIGLWER